MLLDPDIGRIDLWFGSIASIPAGWTLCDGTLGTPNLLDRFVIGAGDNFDPDDTGGTEEHNHSFLTSGHKHFPIAGSPLGSGAVLDDETSTNIVTGITNLQTTIPTFEALAYIMFIGT